MSTDRTIEPDDEIVAISAVYAALKRLDLDAQTRVLNYVASKLKVTFRKGEEEQASREVHKDEPRTADLQRSPTDSMEEANDDLDGISPAGKKWMTRNGLNPGQLSAIFSLGVDDIDLVAKSIPGSGKREKLRSVFLLKGIAAYIGTGVARFTHEQVKEASLHYDAFDATNFAAHFKTIASEVSGDKNGGYTLTTRGLTSGTELLKGMLPTK